MQGLFVFPGIAGEISADVTWTKGPSPSVIRVVVLPSTAGSIPKPGLGTAQWYFNDVLVRSCPNCKITSVQPVDVNGGVGYELMMLDRRWMWRNGQITGEYNLRAAGKVLPSREKTPRELAEMLLDAMGEDDRDVTALPEDDRPYVNWQIANPSLSLADLCDLYACQISYEIDDSVKIVQSGSGVPIPKVNSHSGGHPRLSYEPIIEAVALPEKHRVVSAPTRWQVDLRLEPVGREKDSNEFIPIDDLSYTPTGQDFSYSFNGVTLTGVREVTVAGKEPSDWDHADSQGKFPFLSDRPEIQAIAKEHIFRSWRVTVEDIKTPGEPEYPLEEDYEIPEENFLKDALVPLIEIKQILPLIAKQVEVDGIDDTAKPLDPVIWGQFLDGKPIGRLKLGMEESESLEMKHYDPTKVFEGNFDIDEERGLVHFQEQIKSQGIDSDTGKKVPVRAEMFLRCSINLYDYETREVQRYKRDLNVDKDSPGGIAYEKREDVEPEYYRSQSGEVFEWRDNKDAVNEELAFYLTQAIKRYVRVVSETASYSGLIPQNLDGVIHQVSWRIEQSGVTTSSVDRNTETSRASITYAEQRRRQRLADAIKDRAERQRERKKEERNRKRYGRGE